MSKKFVNFDTDDSVSKYFKDIKKSVLITQKEEIDIAKRIIDGDENAITELVNANLKFVISIAKDYQNKGLLLSDLINEGNYGLIKAAHKFDHKRGFRFISYAVWWIRQSILQSLNDNARMVRLPANVIGKINYLNNEINRFEFEYEREPVYGEILDKDNEPLALTQYAKCSSLNQLINEDGDEMADLIPNYEDDDIEEVDNVVIVELNNIIDTLSEKEKDIIQCYFGVNTNCESMTLEAIGEKYSLTKERIRQIKQKALRKLRNQSSTLHNIINA